MTLFLVWFLTQNPKAISSLGNQQADTSIVSFPSGIIHINSHMLALLRESKSNANQVLDHRKIIAVSNPTILKTEFLKYYFQFLDKGPFPAGIYCHLCYALLAWAAARYLVVSYWQNCLHMVFLFPHKCALPPTMMLWHGLLTSFLGSCISCWINSWPAPLYPVTFTVHLFRGRHWIGLHSSGCK